MWKAAGRRLTGGFSGGLRRRPERLGRVARPFLASCPRPARDCASSPSSLRGRNKVGAGAVSGVDRLPGDSGSASELGQALPFSLPVTRCALPLFSPAKCF